MLNILYRSSRGGNENLTSKEAIVKGIADDGGLFVPSEIPKIDKPLSEMINMTYEELALYIINKFFVDFNENELKNCVNNAYSKGFDTTEIAPLVEKEGLHFLELFHGPTIAFKDMALSILPHLLKTAVKSINSDKEIIILTATSGDTGKAALEGFKDVQGTKIIVFFPNEGVSPIQKRMMTTQIGDNTHVVGIEGNFDNAQTGVKELFNDKKLKEQLDEKGYMFSSANSINIGRLIPQIVYYFYAYLKLLKSNKIKDGEYINVVVPTGNFGNILASFYAKNMGLPINKMICASNENNVLTQFLRSGIYDKRRELILTDSPSMDILVSSNLERLIYHISNNDTSYVNALMNKLESDNFYELSPNLKDKLNDFYGEYASNDEALQTIKKFYNKNKYLIDPHTAVAVSVYEKYKNETKDDTKTIIVSTASPYKFTRSVYSSLCNNEKNNYSDFELLEILSELSKTPVPSVIKDIENKKIIHKDVCNYKDMKNVLLRILEE